MNRNYLLALALRTREVFPLPAAFPPVTFPVLTRLVNIGRTVITLRPAVSNNTLRSWLK